MAQLPRAPRSTHRPIVTIVGMVLFLTAVEAYPRISLTRTPEATILTCKHRPEPVLWKPPPKELGLTMGTQSSNLSQQIFSSQRATDWIFDTGAMSHVCCNPALMHSTISFAHGPLSQATANFGPHPTPIRGVGMVTLEVPWSFVSSGSRGSMGALLSVRGGMQGCSRVTMNGVLYVPDGGANIISWSQLRSAIDVKLRLKEGQGGELEIWDEGRGQKVMTFVLKDRLYYLDQVKQGVGR